MAGGSKSNPDLDDFLRRIDELESVVKGEAPLDADNEGSSSAGPGSSPNRHQQQSPVDRTVINKTAFKDEPAKATGGGSNLTSDQDGFLRSMEADANERAMKRKKRREEATVFKNRGNELFKMCQYLQAVEQYTQGLECSKDFTILYTNRAQAFNKLGRFEEAKEDCHTALQLEPNHLKARIHLGKAYLGLKEYDTAIKTYQEIPEIDKKQEKTVKGYIAAALLAKSTATSAMEAERLFNEGDTKATGVVQILSKLKQPHQPIPYYAGGFRVLCTAINDSSSQALFRQYGGFQLFTNITAIKQCLDDVIEGDDLMSDVKDLVCVTLELMMAAVKDNIENTAFLVNLSVFPSLVLGLLRKESEGLRQRCVAMLFTLSQNAEGQDGIVRNVELTEMLSLLVTIIQSSSSLAARSAACKLLSNLATNERFNEKFQYGAQAHIIPAFERLLVNYSSLEESLLVCCITMMGQMTHNALIRQAMYCNAQFVQAIVNIIECYSGKQKKELQRKILSCVMTLLLNMCVKWNPRFDLREKTTLPIEGKVFFPILLPLLDSGDENIRKKALGLLSHLLPFGDESLADVAKANYIPKIISVMRGGDQTCGHYGIKCLAVLTQRSDKARNDMIRTDQELKYIQELLKSDSAIMIGNAALVVSHCTQVAGLSSTLVHSGIIKTLLSNTDSSDESVKQNCAIAVAKLATTDQRHLDVLRQCGGIGILHSCMKYIK